jgi:hypothetical protein
MEIDRARENADNLGTAMLLVNHCPSRRETRKQGSKQTALALPSAGSNEKERCRYGRAYVERIGRDVAAVAPVPPEVTCESKQLS